MVDKPKIIEHVVKSLDYTLFDARWIPCSARFVVLGNYARGTGAFQIYEVSKGDVKLLKSVSTAIILRAIAEYPAQLALSKLTATDAAV